MVDGTGKCVLKRRSFSKTQIEELWDDLCTELKSLLTSSCAPKHKACQCMYVYIKLPFSTKSKKHNTSSVSAHQPAHAAGGVSRAVRRRAPRLRQPEGVKAAVAGQAAVQVVWALKGPKGQPASWRSTLTQEQTYLLARQGVPALLQLHVSGVFLKQTREISRSQQQTAELAVPANSRS